MCYLHLRVEGEGWFVHVAAPDPEAALRNAVGL
jgi:hypothetical protein